MKRKLRVNKVLLFVFLFCFLVMIYSTLDDMGVINSIKRYFFDPSYRENYFLNNDTGVMAEPTLFNILKNVIRFNPNIVDQNIIFGTRMFQIIVPLFSIICGYDFYKKYHTIYKFEYYHVKRLKTFLSKKILISAVSMSFAIFASYMLYLVIMFLVSNPPVPNTIARTLFTDIFGESFYLSHMFLYFTLEGLVRFFFIPFVYSVLAQAATLVFHNQKQVLAVPIVWYYGLSAIGYATYMLVPNISIYLNPSVIMASGTYDDINTILLILVNALPLFLSILIIQVRVRHVEV